MTQQLSLTLIFDCERNLANFSFFDVGQKKSYHQANEMAILSHWYERGIKDELKNILKSKICTSIYFSGSFIELLIACDKEMIKTIKSSVKSGFIELLGGTYHHSLSSLYSQSQFDREVKWHSELIRKTFGSQPKNFFNTENIYFNDLGDRLKNLGYGATFTGAIDWYLGENRSQRVFSSRASPDFKIMLISSNHQTLFQDPEIKNLFLQMDVDQLIAYGGWSKIVKMAENNAPIVSLSAQIENNLPQGVYHARQPICGPYRSFGLEHLNGHPLQKSWLKQLYGLSAQLKQQSEPLQKLWSNLASISHLTKLNPDLQGSEEHACYDTYRILSNIISDFELKL